MSLNVTVLGGEAARGVLSAEETGRNPGWVEDIFVLSGTQQAKFHVASIHWCTKKWNISLPLSKENPK